METAVLTKAIKERALELGFIRVGIAPADDFVAYAEALKKRSQEYEFVMNMPAGPYGGAILSRTSPEARSIVCVAYDYGDIAYPEKLTKSVGRAYLSRSYLPLADSIGGARLSMFRRFLAENGCQVYNEYELPERLACARAGIVTFGKNTFAYAGETGSFIILSAIPVDRTLDYDEPTMESHCPKGCRKCLDACPTKAYVEPGRLNPQKCLSYNHWVAKRVPESIRALNGPRIHGCDVCQEACPINQQRLKNTGKKDMFLEHIASLFDLEKVLGMGEKYYMQVVHPIMYNYIPRIKIFQRNAAYALGNEKDEYHVPALGKALCESEPMVRESAAWALGHIGGHKAKEALDKGHRETQTDQVYQAIQQAMKRMES